MKKYLFYLFLIIAFKSADAQKYYYNDIEYEDEIAIDSLIIAIKPDSSASVIIIQIKVPAAILGDTSLADGSYELLSYIVYSYSNEVYFQAISSKYIFEPIKFHGNRLLNYPSLHEIWMRDSELIGDILNPFNQASQKVIIIKNDLNWRYICEIGTGSDFYQDPRYSKFRLEYLYLIYELLICNPSNFIVQNKYNRYKVYETR